MLEFHLEEEREHRQHCEERKHLDLEGKIASPPFPLFRPTSPHRWEMKKARLVGGLEREK